jgi:hypothetical protein
MNTPTTYNAELTVCLSAERLNLQRTLSVVRGSNPHDVVITGAPFTSTLSPDKCHTNLTTHAF